MKILWVVLICAVAAFEYIEFPAQAENNPPKKPVNEPAINGDSLPYVLTNIRLRPREPEEGETSSGHVLILDVVHSAPIPKGFFGRFTLPETHPLHYYPSSPKLVLTWKLWQYGAQIAGGHGEVCGAEDQPCLKVGEVTTLGIQAKSLTWTKFDGDGGLRKDVHEFSFGSLWKHVKDIEGFLEYDDAQLLASSVLQSLQEQPRPLPIVEIGAWKGKSTVAMGLLLMNLSPRSSVFSVDPLEGEITLYKDGDPTKPFTQSTGESTVDEFVKNVKKHRLDEGTIQIFKVKSTQLKEWNLPIGMLFIDGLHEYSHVSADFHFFEPFLVDGALIQFGACNKSDNPEIADFVLDLVKTEKYAIVGVSKSHVVIRKLPQERFMSGGNLILEVTLRDGVTYVPLHSLVNTIPE